MQPIFKINGIDYASSLAENGLFPVRNDLDADNSGRNLLNGKMVRKRIAQKLTWNVSFLRLGEEEMKSIAAAVDKEFIKVTMLNPKTNEHEEKSYYVSTFTYGEQRYDRWTEKTFYDGCTFTMVEE